MDYFPFSPYLTCVVFKIYCWHYTILLDGFIYVCGMSITNSNFEEVNFFVCPFLLLLLFFSCSCDIAFYCCANSKTMELQGNIGNQIKRYKLINEIVIRMKIDQY